MSAKGDHLAELLQLAEAQRGVVVSQQVRLCRIPPPMMRRFIADGWFRTIRPHAFAVAGRPPSRWENTIAVGLLGGPGSALSHSTAAAIHGFAGIVVPSIPELTVARPRHPRLAGSVLHRVERLDDDDLVRRSGVNVTTPERTLLDMASRLDRPLMARILDEGTIAKLWVPEDILMAGERTGLRGRPGSAVLRSLIAERVDEPPCENLLELRICRMLAPFAPFETQYQLVLDGELIILDIAWPQWRVGAEVDGWWVRSRSRTKFDRGLHRANLLSAHNWQIAHLTATMEAATVRRHVGRLLPAGFGLWH